MNVFRFIGDMSHVASILVFSYIVFMKGNASGVSRKAQELYLLVFLSRYLDLLTTFYSLYNSVLKIFFIVSTAAILYGLRYLEPAKSTYSVTQDRFASLHALVPAGTVALLIHFLGSGGSVEISGGGMEMHYGQIDILELLWTFSICLEPMAMLPQLAIFHRNRNLNTELRIAIGCMGFYRFLYIFNWVYRATHEPYYKHHFLVYTAAVLQLLFYSDFCYHHGRLLILRLREHRSAGGTADDSTFAQEASVPLISEDFVTNESELVARNVEKSEDADTKASDPARPTSDAYPQLQVV